MKHIKHVGKLYNKLKIILITMNHYFMNLS